MGDREVQALADSVADLVCADVGSIDMDRSKWVAEAVRDLIRAEIRRENREETK